MKLSLLSLILVSLAAVACGSAPPADAKAADPSAPGASDPAAPGAAVPRPACVAIHEACDPYENETPKGKECHDLGESPATTDAVCSEHQAECMAACPKK